MFRGILKDMGSRVTRLGFQSLVFLALVEGAVVRVEFTVRSLGSAQT